MRDFSIVGRSAAVAEHGMVATSAPMATLAGLDVLRAGHALADLELAVLGLDHRSTRAAARAVAAAWLMGEGPERDALLLEARGLRPEVDPAALPILLPALSLGDTRPWLRPLTYWWAARRGRY